MSIAPGQLLPKLIIRLNAKMEPSAMKSPMEEHAVMTTAVVQNALKIILKCVLVLFVLLEEQTIVVLLQSYVKNTEEYDNVKGLVRFNL